MKGEGRRAKEEKRANRPSLFAFHLSAIAKNLSRDLRTGDPFPMSRLFAFLVLPWKN